MSVIMRFQRSIIRIWVNSPGNEKQQSQVLQALEVTDDWVIGISIVFSFPIYTRTCWLCWIVRNAFLYLENLVN